MARKPIVVSREDAQRIAVRTQLLDGSADSVLETVRRLGYLQLDPISVVAPPQHMVLFSRLGAAYDRAELERLLWVDRELFEWNAFLWPKESLPIIRAWMRKPRRSEMWAQRVDEFIKANAKFRRYLLRELETRGPLPSRELSADLVHRWAQKDGGWWGTRNVTLLLELLHRRGEVAVVGRLGTQRLWGLGAAWYPECERITFAEANRRHDEQRFRALGVRYDKARDRWLAHPDAADASPVPDRAVLLSPFDRLIHNRDRTEALWDFYYRLEMYVPKTKREYGYYVLPLLVGDKLIGRAEPVFDKKTRVLRLLGAWGDTSRLNEALTDLASWLGATAIER